MKLSARMMRTAKTMKGWKECMWERVDDYAREVEVLELQLSKSKQQYNELVNFVSSLQLDSVSDDCALEQLLEKHKGE